jgi:2'-5' RNA ligase
VKRLSPVPIRAGAVLTFPKTDVVYLEITSGHEDLLSMHARLNVGDLAFQEEYAYHPHITLAQNFNPSQLHAIQEIASTRWREFDGERGFLMDRLTFVRYEGSNGWVDIAECRLALTAP